MTFFHYRTTSPGCDEVPIAFQIFRTWHWIISSRFTFPFKVGPDKFSKSLPPELFYGFMTDTTSPLLHLTGQNPPHTSSNEPWALLHSTCTRPICHKSFQETGAASKRECRSCAKLCLSCQNPLFQHSQLSLVTSSRISLSALRSHCAVTVA